MPVATDSEAEFRRVAGRGPGQSDRVGTMASRGPRPKGGAPRRQLTIRMPAEYLAAYDQMSKTLGMPLGDVILYYAAQGAGLPVPDYVETAVEASRNDLQEALVA